MSSLENTHRPDGAHAVEDLAEDDVLAVEPGRLDGGDEELKEIRVARLILALSDVVHLATLTWLPLVSLPALAMESQPEP